MFYSQKQEVSEQLHVEAPLTAGVCGCQAQTPLPRAPGRGSSLGAGKVLRRTKLGTRKGRVCQQIRWGVGKHVRVEGMGRKPVQEPTTPI